MILAFLIISLVIWTITIIANFYLIVQQSKSSNVSLSTVFALIVNLLMITINILALASL